MSDYPQRESHFAHRVIRLLVRTCAAQEIGTDGCLLVVVIAHTEHAKWYSAPVTFWNDQLMSVLGFTWGKLDRARKKAIAAGWLHYEPGGKGNVGKYWSLVPKPYEGLPDGPVDEDVVHDSITFSSSPVERQTGENRGTNGGQPGDKCGTFIPIPKPIPTPLSSPEATGGEEASESANGKPKPDKLQELIGRWNRIDGIQHVRQPTQKRQKALAARMRESQWREAVPEALSRISKSSFCCGRGEQGWRADIDWFLRPDTVTRILEGKYDDRDKITNNQPPPEGLY